MRPVAVGLWLTVLGCGRLAFDPETSIAPTCPALAGAWTLEPPVLVPELSSPADDREPYITNHGLDAYVSNLTTDTWRSYHTTRAASDASWQPLADAWADGLFSSVTRVTVTADGLEAFVSALASPTDDADLWIASRATPQNAFGAFARLDAASTPDSDVDVYPTDDALRLYFATQPAGSDSSTLVVAERAARDAPFGAAVPVPGISDDHADNPAVTPDDRMLIYSSHPGGGSGDLMYVVRSSPDEPFGPPRPLPVVNGPYNDTEVDLWGCDLYFASNPAGNLDIYRSQFVLGE